jgi:hypothetical protein
MKSAFPWFATMTKLSWSPVLAFLAACMGSA